MSEAKVNWESLRDLDPQALSTLHQRYYPDVLRFALYRTGDRMLAEDLASEVFIRLIDALHAGKGPKSNARGWLLGTTNNLVNDHYRKHYRNPSNHELNQDLMDSTSHIDVRLDTQGQLASALATLTDEQQMVLSLRFGAEMSLEETAEAMGKKANAIKALQFRAITSLRQQMRQASDD